MKIKELTLLSTKISEIKNFYSNAIKLPINNENADYIEYIIGNSLLRFVVSEYHTPYHFAINIPSNKIEEAYKWQKEKTNLINSENKEIITFESWNARSIFFYDPDKNIVEFIARSNLNNQAEEAFSEKCFIGISEIGTPVKNIEDTYNLLHRKLGLNIYDGNFEGFCAAGDEHGLFILIDKNKKKWFPSMDEAFFSEYQTKIEYDSTETDFIYRDGILLK